MKVREERILFQKPRQLLSKVTALSKAMALAFKRHGSFKSHAQRKKLAKHCFRLPGLCPIREVTLCSYSNGELDRQKGRVACY